MEDGLWPVLIRPVIPPLSLVPPFPIISVPAARTASMEELG